MSIHVVSFVAVCDIDTPLEHFAQLRAKGWSVPQARDECVQFARSLHFTVREVACTDDSRVIPLRENLGWGSHANHLGDDEHWRALTADHISRSVLTAVLPDDAEDTGDQHPWSEFVTILAATGVPTTPAELAALPYSVVFAPRLHDALNGDRVRSGWVDVDAWVDR